MGRHDDIPRSFSDYFCAALPLSKNAWILAVFAPRPVPRVAEHRVDGDEGAIICKVEVDDVEKMGLWRQLHILERRARPKCGREGVAPGLELGFQFLHNDKGLFGGLSHGLDGGEALCNDRRNLSMSNRVLEEIEIDCAPFEHAGRNWAAYVVVIDCLKGVSTSTVGGTRND